MEVSGGDGHWVDGAKTRSLTRKKKTRSPEEFDGGEWW